ncbi:MAG: transporter [Comamonadaceae bacterium]|nr:transporter [Comamonadaceae bacterium]
MLSIIGIVLSLALLMLFAYRGVSVLLLAPLAALLAVLATPEVPLLASYTQVFMRAAGGFITLFFPLFLLGAVFGKLMEDSGAARVIALRFVDWLGERRAVLAVVLACAVLTYGGVSLFVVAFAVYPIAVELFRKADVPKRLIPATIALGAFTFTMTALPGTPAIQNAIPMPYFGTTPFAAPGLGVIGALLMLVCGVWWLNRRERKAAASGEGFGDEPAETPDPGAAAVGAPTSPVGTAALERRLRPHAQGEGYDVAELGPLAAAVPVLPGIGAALAPIVAVVALNWLFSTQWLPRLDSTYLALPLYGATRLEAVLGTWSIIAALALANLGMLIGLRRSLAAPKATLDAGASAAVLPIFNTASQVGYGAVIASLAGFVLIRDAVLGIAPDNPLISLAVAVNVLAGVTGSASGGMSIALQTLGSTYLEMGRAAGIEPALLHRVTSIATGGLDTLPHNGAVITLLAICKLTHRQSYFDIFVVAVLFPLLALAGVVALGSVFGSF